MSNVFSINFILSNDELRYSRCDLVERLKESRDDELNIALQVAQQKDPRSFMIWKTDWNKRPVSGGTKYSRTVYLLLTDPEQATSPDDLVWMPDSVPLKLNASVYISPSGKVFRPVGERKLVWRLEAFQEVVS